MKLYVWPEFERDFKAGLAFAIADDSEEARRMITEKTGFLPNSLAESPEVYELNNKIAYAVTGGQ